MRCFTPAVPVAVLAALLTACATPEGRTEPVPESSMQNALDTMNAAAADMEAMAAEVAAEAFTEEFSEVARNCGLPTARLIKHGDQYRVGLPPEIYAVRNRASVNGRVRCITHWGLEIGHDLEIVEAR